MMKQNNKKPKIAIFDLTDCEGCELQFLALRELLEIDERVDIINWRLVSERNQIGPYDIAFVEGTPVTNQERKEIVKVRKSSRILVALGACACIGGIPAIVSKKDRKKILEKVYGKKYRTFSTNARPINDYVSVDFFLNGCPVDKKELEELVNSLLFGKVPPPVRYPVCFECKEKENICLLLEGQPCLGPVTKAGCGAACTSCGIRCWGCFGPVKQANLKALKKVFKKYLNMSDADIKKELAIFFREINEFKELFKEEE